jgi:hypothetical protein
MNDFDEDFFTIVAAGFTKLKTSFVTISLLFHKENYSKIKKLFEELDIDFDGNSDIVIYLSENNTNPLFKITFLNEPTISKRLNQIKTILSTNKFKDIDLYNEIIDILFSNEKILKQIIGA